MTGQPAGAREIETVVPTAVGDLAAIVRFPDRAGPLPGVVLVEGSGDADRHSWGGWPEWIADAGSVTLRHDKPGCGGSPGRWVDQSFTDRARESLAAIDVLREHVPGRPVGLYGTSQGGWVALLAAALDDRVDFVVCHSGPAISPAEQERSRIGEWLRAEGLDGADVADGLAWVDERADRLRAGESPASVLAAQAAHADRPWHPTATLAYDTADRLAFVARILDFDPVTVLPSIRCPVLVLLGGADSLVPAHRSMAAFARHLPPAPHGHGLVVFPGADHGLFVGEPRQGVARRAQLAPGYEPILEAFLRAANSRKSDHRHRL